MGCSASKASPAGAQAAAPEQAGRPAGHGEQLPRRPAAGAAGEAAAVSERPRPARLPLPESSMKAPEVMREVKNILQQLLDVKPNGPASCEECVHILHDRLQDAALVCLSACSPSNPAVATLVAAEGLGAEGLLRQVVLPAGSGFSGGPLAELQPSSSGGQGAPVYYRTAATPKQAAKLPQDWAELFAGAGLRTFVSLPVVARDRVVGVLGVASTEAGAFQEDWWEPVLSILCMGPVSLLKCPHMAAICELLVQLHAAPSIPSFAATLLAGCTALLRSYTNLQLSTRFGLLSPDGQEVLLLRCKRVTAGDDADASSQSQQQLQQQLQQPLVALAAGGEPPPVAEAVAAATAAAAAAGAEEGMAVLRLAAGTTLLLDTLTRRAPRIVRNTVAYLEGKDARWRDVFVEGGGVVSSILAAPLHVAGQPYGALYIAHSQPWAEGDEGLCRATAAVEGLAGLLQRLMAGHAAGRRELAWEQLFRMHTRVRRSSQLDPPTTPRKSSRTGGAHQRADAWADMAPAGAHSASSAAAADTPSCSPATPSTSTSAGAAAAGALHEELGRHQQRQQQQLLLRHHMQQQVQAIALMPQGSLRSLGSGVPSSSSSGGVREQMAPTGSMVEMLRQQVLRSSDRQRGNDYVEELKLARLLGKGGFGYVYEGTWKGAPAAIKVMSVSQHERQLMKNAMEMAVLTTVRHPNVVRVFACLTDMIEEGADVPGGGADNPVQRRFRPAPGASSLAGLGELCTQPTCNIIVMELCDRGNLRQAMRRGLLHRRIEGIGLAVDVRLLVTVLLETARSVQYLHSLGIIHCDVKAENVLLRSCPHSATGFVCLLGDFGLVKFLQAGRMYFTNRSGSGTVTHLAPELFEAGSKVTPAVDAYSFGVMMFELYSCQRLYAGMNAESIIKQVLLDKARPQFPAGTPPSYQRLAERCWAQSREERPSFDEIVQELQALLGEAGGPFPEKQDEAGAGADTPDGSSADASSAADQPP